MGRAAPLLLLLSWTAPACSDAAAEAVRSCERLAEGLPAAFDLTDAPLDTREGLDRLRAFADSVDALRPHARRYGDLVGVDTLQGVLRAWRSAERAGGAARAIAEAEPWDGGPDEAAASRLLGYLEARDDFALEVTLLRDGIPCPSVVGR